MTRGGVCKEERESLSVRAELWKARQLCRQFAGKTSSSTMIETMQGGAVRRG